MYGNSTNVFDIVNNSQRFMLSRMGGGGQGGHASPHPGPVK